ncbi:MAG TPA: dTDP-4-dehydrorhamnose 3,5-epimerase [Anaerolineae bacterium]
METKAIPTSLEGVVVVEIAFVRDARGFFIESYHKRQFAQIGITDEFVQDNHSRSARGVLRGLHYQDRTAPMAKLVRCTRGAIFDVVVDLRAGSPTFGKWFAIELSEENMKQLFVSVGFAHGFYTLTDIADVQYKCTGLYVPAAEGNMAWNDPDLAIDWPDRNPILSRRDGNGMSLKQYLANPAFHYRS